MWKFLILLVISYSVLMTASADSISTCSCGLDQFLKDIASNSLKLLAKLIELKSDVGAPVFSLIPIVYNLAALASFSCKETRQEILKVLNVSSVNQIQCILSQLNRRMQQIEINEDLQFNPNGTYLFANDKYPLTSNFVNTLQNLAVLTSNIDLNNPDKGEDDTNSFVRSRTTAEGKRYSEIQSAQLSDNDRFYAWDYLYYRSALKCGFDLSQTFTDNFYLSPNDVVPDISYITGIFYCKYGYISDINSKVIQMEFQQGFSVVYVLPDSGIKLCDVIDKLVTYDNIACLPETLPYKWVNVTILYNPDHLETVFNTIRLTRSVFGDLRIYDYRRAQIRGAVVGDPPMSLTYGIQKLYWKTQYTGTEKCSNHKPPQESFTANRPSIGYVTRKGLIYMNAAFINPAKF